MNENEIREIIKDPKRVNTLADEFRRGRDVCDLLPLLNSENKEIVGVAAWIVGEVTIDPSKAEPVMSRLHDLLNDADPSVRFLAMGALFPHISKETLVTMSSDPNEGVRIRAQSALKRLLEK